MWLGYMTVACGRAAGASTFPFTWIGNADWQKWMEANIGRTPEDMANQWREVFEWMFPRLTAATEQAGIV